MFPKNFRILVVDDMRTMRLVVKSALKALGHENTVEADDGETAWPMIEEASAGGQPFHLILSDWNMPQMKGIELLKKVRSHSSLGGTPFILITAETEKAQIVEAVKEGVSGYLMKPFTPEALGEKINVIFPKQTA